ncbi:hypothetical protein [Rhizobium sp. AP16]|uniref:hypothetical protein n=1 Tax=Rhizobium sp. AP16 TaxID=1144306 RepID=UPI00030166F7|nr:hypothetical protein [Rhizobium sp. AP16]
MEQQSIFERVMNRGNARLSDDDLTPAGTFREPETAAESGNEETETVKTHNRLLLISSAGAVILGVLATAVLAQQDVISLPSFMVAQKSTPTPTPKGTTATARTATSKDAAAAGDSGAAPAAAATDQEKTIFNEHIDQAGVTACREVFPALGFVAASGSTFNATTSWSEKDSNDHSIFSIVGMSFNSDQFRGSGASVIFSAPTPAKGGCEGSFVRVVPVGVDCNTFAGTLPKDSKLGPSLQGLPVVTLPSGVQTVLLPSAGNGCVVLTTSRAAVPGNS